MTRAALIIGVSGAELTSEEKAFLGDARPCGLILFTRNCVNPDQMRALISDVKSRVGSDDLLVLIDQEGGRVQRLRPPLGRALPPAAAYGRLYQQSPASACRAANLAARLLADDLRDLGINTVCAPVLDVPVPGAHAVIGDRAYGAEPTQIAALGRAVSGGFLDGGVLPVIKHIPGHGRARADSHFDLPIVTDPRSVLSATDFAAFKPLANNPLAMTAHVVFTSIDAAEPASTSLIVTQSVIRGEIGFDGLLMSDDLSMKALKGTIRCRAEAVIRAGSDVALHCNGDLAEMREAVAGVPILGGRAEERFKRALGYLSRHRPYDKGEAEAILSGVLAGHASATESV